MAAVNDGIFLSVQVIALSILIVIVLVVCVRLEEQAFEVKLCDNTTSPVTVHLYGNYKAASEFYVFVGVTAFLYCLGILLFYVFGDDKYRNVENIPIVVSMWGQVVGVIICAIFFLKMSTSGATGPPKRRFLDSVFIALAIIVSTTMLHCDVTSSVGCDAVISIRKIYTGTEKVLGKESKSKVRLYYSAL